MPIPREQRAIGCKLPPCTVESPKWLIIPRFTGGSLLFKKSFDIECGWYWYLSGTNHGGFSAEELPDV